MIVDFVLALTGVLLVMWCAVRATLAWIHRPMVVWSEEAGRWVSARSRARIEWGGP